MTTTNSNETFSVATENENVEAHLVNQWKNAFKFMCKKFISSVKFSLFKTNYKEIYTKDPDNLKTMHEQLCSQLAKSVAEDLDEIYAQHSIELLLNSLDVILKKYQDLPQISWRPSGNPQEDLLDHIYPIKLKQKELLEEILNKLSVNNEELISTAAIKHAEILDLKQTNDALHQEFRNIAAAFTGHNLKKFQNTLSVFVLKEE